MREAYLEYVSLNAFIISNTFKSNARLKLEKNQVNARPHFETERLIAENYSHSSPTLSSNNKQKKILKNEQKNKHVCIHEIRQLIIMKTKTKIKIDSHRSGINIAEYRHEHKYSIYMKRLSMTMLICIRQHLSKI